LSALTGAGTQQQPLQVPSPYKDALQSTPRQPAKYQHMVSPGEGSTISQVATSLVDLLK